MKTLTLDDHAEMRRQGWCIASLRNGYELRRAAISTFRDDASAWLHVFDLALERDPLAVRALSFLQEFDPFEFACVARYMAIYRPRQVALLQEASKLPKAA